jgi:methylmalonyl-CoA/ethylmalonyl-CoA epimerase
MEKAGSIDIKPLELVDETSSIYRFSLIGGGIRHLCFKCESLKEKVEERHGAGYRILSGPEPEEAFENNNIAIIHMNQDLNIEMIDTEKRARLLL